jgi:hypothetical protein
MKKASRIYTKTAQTADEDAILINTQLNDVARMIHIGKELKKIKDRRFGSCLRAFRRWVRMSLDKDEKSIFRYIALAEAEDLLRSGGIIKLSDAYDLLGISGNIEIQ